MKENLLNFPHFTIVNRVVPKTAFYSHLEVNTRMKTLFVENVDQIVWLYKLAPSNLHIADGKEVHEITVFLVKMKHNAEDSKALFRFIDCKMPRHTLFILNNEERYRYLVNYKQWKDDSLDTFDIIKSFATPWMPMNGLSLVLDLMSSMDTLYDSLVRQIASSQITSSKQNLHQAITETIDKEAIKKEMEAIKRKEARERQPQKKFALHQQYIKLKKELEEN